MIDRNIAEKMPFLRFHDDHGTEVVELTSRRGERYHLEFEEGNVFDEALVIAVIKEDLLSRGCSLEVEEVGTGYIGIKDLTHQVQYDNFYMGQTRVQAWASFWDTMQRRKNED